MGSGAWGSLGSWGVWGEEPRWNMLGILFGDPRIVGREPGGGFSAWLHIWMGEEAAVGVNSDRVHKKVCINIDPHYINLLILLSNKAEKYHDSIK